MDSFEFNKIAGAVLATALGVMAVSIIADMIYTPKEAETPGYEVAVAEPAPSGAAAAPAAPEVAPIAARLQSADPKAGAAKAKACLVCHTLGKGEAAKIGPNLYGVVGSPVIHHTGFKYSQAMQDKGAAGMTWTFENLDKFLTSPKDFIPGTAMGFAGLKSPTDRANVIDYLRTNADNPLPLPPPPATAAPAPTAEAPAAPAAPSAPAAPAAGGAPSGFDAMLASADVAAGKAKAKVCLTCHTLNEGGAARVGPNLYGVVGGPAAHMEGYAYSQAMQQKHANGFTWTFDNLNQFLTSPRDFIPGTKMTFAGLKNEKDRANVIAYLNSNSAKPLPLPAPQHSTPLPPPAGGSPPEHSTPLPPPTPQ
jgi:cytochrome c